MSPFEVRSSLRSTRSRARREFPFFFLLTSRIMPYVVYASFDVCLS